MEKEMLAILSFKEGKFDTFMGWMASAVSYTHLTLPTILRV